jgi:hypothetical protein
LARRIESRHRYVDLIVAASSIPATGIASAFRASLYSDGEAMPRCGLSRCGVARRVALPERRRDFIASIPLPHEPRLVLRTTTRDHFSLMERSRL